MAIHKPWDRPFYVLGGSVMTNGFSLNLAEGQFGIFNTTRQTPKGSVAVDAFNGATRDTTFELKLGHNNAGGRSLSNKKYSSFPFSIKDVIDVRVSAPKRKDDLVDELVIGYDGIDPKTSIQLNYGDEKEIVFKLSGKALEYLGAPEGQIVVPTTLSAPALMGNECLEVDNCGPVDMLPIIKEAVEYVKNYEQFGVKFEHFAEVTPVIKLTNPVAQTPGGPSQYTHTISVNDTGDSIALALVQQQYPGEVVVRDSRNGITSNYKVVTSTAKLAPYEQKLSSILPECETCPTGYTATSKGFLYAQSVEDDGATAPVAVPGITAWEKNGQQNGVGFYTGVAANKIKLDVIDTALATNLTATVGLVGEVGVICANNGKVTTTEWVVGEDVLQGIVESYVISVPDTECGSSRLAEIQAAYPDLVITETEVVGGCQRQYTTTVSSNFVEEQCDPIFKDTFKTEAPASFDGNKWEKVEVAGPASVGLYGIRVKAKKFKLASGECLRDAIGYTEDSLEIQAAGGYIRDFNLGVNYLRNIKDTPYKVTYITNKTPRTHVAGRMLSDEKVANSFFSGIHIDYDYMGRILTGNESKIVNLDAQFVDYVIELRRNIYAQSLSQRVEETIAYHIYVEVGQHEGVEALLNSLAGAAGLPGVQAFGK